MVSSSLQASVVGFCRTRLIVIGTVAPSAAPALVSELRGMTSSIRPVVVSHCGAITEVIAESAVQAPPETWKREKLVESDHRPTMNAAGLLKALPYIAVLEVGVAPLPE